MYVTAASGILLCCLLMYFRISDRVCVMLSVNGYGAMTGFIYTLYYTILLPYGRMYSNSLELVKQTTTKGIQRLTNLPYRVTLKHINLNSI